MALLSLADFQTRLRNGPIKGLYLFDGPEEWLKKNALEKIIEKCLPESARDTNLEKFHGDDASGGDVAQAIQSLPFCADTRFVVVYNIQNMKVGDRRLIAEACANAPDSTTAVFLHEGKSSVRDELAAQVNSRGTVVTFWSPFPNQMPQWISNLAEEKGKSISYEAASWLADVCVDLQMVSSELDKLILFVGDKKEITNADVTAYGRPDGEGDFDDLEQALWTRNLRGILTQTHLLEKMGVRAEAMFPVFERVFRRLVMGYFLLDEKGMSRADLYQNFGFRGRTRQGFLDSGFRNYSRAESVAAIDKIVGANMDLKTGFLSSEHAAALLGLKLALRQ